METLVIAHHRTHHHQYHGRKRGHGSGKLDSFGSAPSKNIWGNSCRGSFHTGAGLLPTPSKSASTPGAKKALSASVNRVKKCSDPNRRKTTTGPIPIRLNFEDEVGNLDSSESWAGTAYSISPPPSSLPLPMFALRPKRTVSLDLPTLASEIDLPPMAKSAPASPSRECNTAPRGRFDSTENATKTLRRILNLEITDD